MSDLMEIRQDSNGNFDELFVNSRGRCLVHAEMMDDGLLWIGIYPPGSQQGVMVWIGTKNGKLTVTAEKD